MKFRIITYLFFGIGLIFYNCGKIENQNGIERTSSSLDSAISKYEKFIYKDGIYGGTVRFPLYKEPKSFNPYVEPGNVPFMYEGLMNFSCSKLEKRLVDRVEISEDSLMWRFKLRQDLLWSDSISITNDDVLFTYNEALKNCDEKNIYYSLLGEKSEIHPYTVTVDVNDGIVFKFKQFSEMVKELFAIPILPKHRYESMITGSFCDSLSANTSIDCMVGSGPYVLSGYAPFGRVMFVKNKHYYRKDYKGQSLPYIDTLEFVMFSDIEEALSVFKEKKLDFIAADGIDMREVKGFKEYNHFKQNVSHNGNMLLLNHNSDLYKKLGSAGFDILWQLIPRDLILDSLLNDDGVFDYPLSFWYNLNLSHITFSVAKAQKMFKEYGFKKNNNGELLAADGSKITCSFLVSSANGFRSQMADIIADRFKMVGISVEINKMGPDEFFSEINKGDWCAVLTSYDEGNSIKSALTFWSDLAIDSMGRNELIKMSRTVSSESRKDSLLGNEILQIVKKAVPAIFLVRSSRNILTSKKIENVNPSPFGGFTGDVSRLYIKDGKKVDDKKQ